MDKAKAGSMMAARNECHSKVAGFPDVFATSVGFRHVAGIMTNELAICVHVTKKRTRRELGRVVRIPASIDGLPIDVVEDRPPILAAAKVRPVVGGIEVQGSGFHYGTLGCMVKDNGGKVYMLSNEHVFGGVGTKTYQPATGMVCDQIGWVTKAESIRGGEMDCAISNLTRYDDGGLPEIQGIGEVLGQRNQYIDDKVSKSGANTGVTSGTVVNVDYTVDFDGVTVKKQLRVMSDDNTKAFGEQGDSGAVVVTRGIGKDERKCWVGGLLWGVASTRFSKVNIYGYVTPIEIVLAKMEVQLLTASKQLLKTERAADETALDRMAALLNQSRRGQGYWQSFLRNQHSLQRLFAESSRLAAALNGIPLEALMDTVLKAGTDPESPIPSQIGGASTADVISLFSTALRHHVEDAELKSQIESLSGQITHNIGRSWREALEGV